MTDLHRVAEGLLDSAARKYRKKNLSSASTVQQYADAGMGISMSGAEAERIRVACQSWLADEADNFGSTAAWHRLVTGPLA